MTVPGFCANRVQREHLPWGGRGERAVGGRRRSCRRVGAVALQLRWPAQRALMDPQYWVVGRCTGPTQIHALA